MDCQEIHKIKFLFINASDLWIQIILEELCNINNKMI